MATIHYLNWDKEGEEHGEATEIFHDANVDETPDKIDEEAFQEHWREVAEVDVEHPEEAWKQWNAGSRQESEQFLNAEVRSMSVGDIVEMGGTYYLAAPVGFEEVEITSSGFQPEEYAGDTVKLIKGISGVMHTPEIIEGTFSSTGKTIMVEVDRGSRTKTYRLDAEELMTGGLEVRRATTFKLYTPDNLSRQQKANYAPGPQAGADTKQDPEELPAPTHMEVEA